MMRGINDQAWRADLLGDVLNSYGDWGWVHVNLIPLNPTPGSKWTASDPADEREFVRRLEAKGIPTTVRDTRGREIDGACGQLAAVEAPQIARTPVSGQQVRGLVHGVDEVDVRLHRPSAGEGASNGHAGRVSVQYVGPPAPSAPPRTRRRSSSRTRPGTPPARCRPAPGRKTIPAWQTSSRIASRMALRTYLAIAVASTLGGSCP